MARIIGTKLYVYSKIELENEMCRYDCLTKEELAETLWEDFRMELIIDYKIES